MSMQRSVHRQNADTKADIERTALSYARDTSGRFEWLRSLLASQGLAPSAGVLVRIKHTPEQGGEFYKGVWLSQDGRFWEFEVTVPRAPGKPLEVERFADASTSLAVSAHLPGTGKSFGFLANQVLSEQHEA